MSHIVEIKTEVRDVVAAEAACQRLQLEAPVQGTAQLFLRSASGLIVKLPDWKFPAVFDTQTGQAWYDNYGGHWGEQRELDRFLQGYAVEKAKLEARRRGHSVFEQPLPDGSIKLTIQVGGVA